VEPDEINRRFCRPYLAACFLLFSYFNYSFSVKKVAIFVSETTVDSHKILRYLVPKDGILRSRRSEGVRSRARNLSVTRKARRL
jgi:hypothetical protein